MKEEKKTITDKEHFELWSKLIKKHDYHKKKEIRIKKLIEINAKLK
jgi:hypothetical protein